MSSAANIQYAICKEEDRLIFTTPAFKVGPDSVLHSGIYNREFSSMLAGAVPFRKLYSYGLAELSDPADVDAVDRLFAVRDKPICLAHF